MTREEFKKVIIRYKKFYGKGKFLTDKDTYEKWYLVFHKKSYTVFNHAATRFTRRPSNLNEMPDLARMIKEYEEARKECVKRMEILKGFFLEAQAVYPEHLRTDEDEEMFFYLIQTDDYDMCYRRAEFLRDATFAYVERLTNLGELAKWKTLSDQFLRTVERYNEGIPRRVLGPEEDDEAERYGRASYYWSLADRLK